MKIVATSDWRDAIEFETPMIVADLVPGEATRCFVCGHDSAPRPRTELWAVKHRHPNDHGGHVRFYCLDHRPAPVRNDPPPVITPAARSAARERRAAAPRKAPAAPERQAPVCPTCFIEIPPTGVCGMCGERIA
ncbi:MAG: glucose-6-phosphate dehydrogenase [Actinobacteria bacterium]|nr:glucose-6-phosphate dehydrogenase [Actinomycetota bacterium]